VEKQVCDEEWGQYSSRLLNQGLWSASGCGVFHVNQPIHPISHFVNNSNWGRTHFVSHH